MCTANWLVILLSKREGYMHFASVIKSVMKDSLDEES